jgi:hypothetical protein
MVLADEVTQGATLFPKQRAKSKPIPESASVEPAVSTLSLTVRVPLCVPALVGANSTPTVQLAPAASVVPQVLPEASESPSRPRNRQAAQAGHRIGIGDRHRAGAAGRAHPVCAKVSGLGWN